MQVLEKILEEIKASGVYAETKDGYGAKCVPIGVIERIIRKHMNDGWISVEDRLPEEKGMYLVTYHPCYWDDVNPEVEVGIDTFRGKTTWAKKKFQRVIAWQPLPEPYRPERSKNDSKRF